MSDSVLLLTDIAAGRYPTRCVVVGEATQRATHVWAIASPHSDRIMGLLGTATGSDLMAYGIDVAQSPNSAAHILLLKAK